MTMAGEPFPTVSSAPEAWDAIPEAAKLQIVLFVGFLEYVSSNDSINVKIFNVDVNSNYSH